jgi:DNA-binding NarL/FixJ family response regulator
LSAPRDAAPRAVRALLVQARPHVTEDLRERLVRGGVNVVAAVDSAKAAIGETIRIRPDLIVIDIRHDSRSVATVIDVLREVDGRRDAETRTAHALASARERHASLSPREREVFARVVRGRLNKQIASDLRVSERTVKAHRARVMRKMHVDSIAELTRLAERLGI